MSSSSSLPTIVWLNYVNVQLNRYFPLPMIVFGTIGLTLNILIFCRRTLRSNSCSHYLLGNTLANVIVVYWVIITRILSDGYSFDPSLTMATFCKIRYFLTYVPRTLSTWFILLACIDRWASSIQAKRHFNSVLFARVAVIITTIVCCVSYFHILVYFGIQKTATSVSCYALPGPYRIFSDFQYLFFYALGPPLIMLLFGLMTLRNLQRTRRVVMPMTHNNINTQVTRSTVRKDSQILVMILFQVIFIIIFTVPFALEKLYETLTLNVPKTPLHSAQITVWATVVRTLSYVPHAFGFLVYTLSARIFRIELIKLFNIPYHAITGRYLIVAGTTVAGATFTQKNTVISRQLILT